MRTWRRRRRPGRWEPEPDGEYARRCPSPPGYRVPAPELARMSVQLTDRDRRADRHQPGQAQDVGVLQPHAAVRDPAGDQAGLVGPVHADVAAARPVGQRVRRRARPERHRPIDRAGRPVAGQLRADVELALGRGPLRLPDAHAGAECLLALLDQRDPERARVDLQPGVERLQLAQRVFRHPALGPIRPDRQAHPIPGAVLLVGRAREHEHDLVGGVRRARLQPPDGARGALRLGVRDDRLVDERVERLLAGVIEILDLGLRGRRGGRDDRDRQPERLQQHFQPVFRGTWRDCVCRAPFTLTLAASRHEVDEIVSVPFLVGRTLNVAWPLELVLPLRLTPAPLTLTEAPSITPAVTVTFTVVSSFARTESFFGTEMQRSDADRTGTGAVTTTVACTGPAHTCSPPSTPSPHTFAVST